MSNNLRAHRRSSKSRRFRIEWLEGRVVLSTAGLNNPMLPGASMAALITPQELGPNLTIVGISPSDSSTSFASPSTLNVIFDRPVDPFSLGIGDIEVDQKQSDGTWLPIYSNIDGNALNESLDDTGTILELSLTTPLTTGTYRLVLPAGSFLAGLDGSSFADTSSDEDLGQFAIAQTEVTLPDAQNIGPVVPTSPGVGTSTSSWTGDVNGNLDFTSDPFAVNLYKITVPAGHFWRFGAEVQSERLGGSLASAISVFDSQGNVVKISNSGRSSSPNDAYLYAGLAPGTYYIGVSGTGDLPGSLYNGYNPVTGDPGTVAQTQTGGSYDLKLSLDTADTPTQLVSSTLNFADPLSTTPTGLTLTFNGVLDAQTIRGLPTTGFVLTNQAGQTFPLTVVGVNESAGQYTLLFNNKLPVGQYTLSVPGSSGAKDLAGLTPTASNQPAGTLMTFNVAPSLSVALPSNLGSFFNQIHSGQSYSTTILPGTAVTYRMVLTSGGYYHLGQAFASGSVGVQIIGNGLTNVAFTSVGTAGAANGTDRYLDAGIYLISFKNLGTKTVSLTWSIRLSTAWDSFFDNGIGQTSAMSLRLVNPLSATNSDQGLGSTTGPVFNSSTTTTTGPTSPSAPTGGTTSPVAGPITVTLTSSGSGSVTLGNANLILSVGDTLVGRPSLGNDHVNVVGLNTGGGSTALASSGQSLLPGINYGQRLGKAGLGAAAGQVGVGEGAIDPDLPPINGAIVFDAVAAPPKADEALVATSDWLKKLGDLATRLLDSQSSDSAVAITEAGQTERIAMASDDNLRADKVEAASLGTPAAIGLFTMASVRFFNRGRRKIDLNRKKPDGGHSQLLRGPHGRFQRSSADSKV